MALRKKKKTRIDSLETLLLYHQHSPFISENQRCNFILFYTILLNVAILFFPFYEMSMGKKIDDCIITGSFLFTVQYL
jgi:hypothetical protein